MRLSKSTNVQMSVQGALRIFLFLAFLFGGGSTGLVSAKSSACPPGKQCIFIPGVFSMAAGDLVLQGMEVTQAVQDPNNSVPLVEGRTTMLRIYAKTTGAKQPMSNVKVSISASSASSMLNGSPSLYAATVPLSYDRGSLQSTMNINLPENWASGTVDLTVRLDADNLIPELNENNNTLTRRFVFQQVPPLRIKIVPIRYVNTKDGYTYSAPTVDTISNWILRMYPVARVDVSWHAPYTFTGNLSLASDFSKLLDQVTGLKSKENAPDAEVYYALVPTSDGSRNWFYGGIAGIGWVNRRTAVGLDVSGSAGQIAAHEIGHNLGMLHTPCGTPSSVDVNFPYLDGSIGQLGTDVFSGTLYAPTSKDVMSYCTPKWISDYTYKKLLNAQVTSGSTASSLMAAPMADAPIAERGLLFRALIDEKGVQVQPAYVIPDAVYQAPEPGDYQVELIDALGQVISVTPVRAYQVMLDVEEDTHLYGINTIIPLSEQPVAGFRLVKDGIVLGEQTLHLAESSPQISNSAPGIQDQRLQWTGGGQPALVRYSNDGGQTWITAGMDVTSGEMAQAALPEGDVIFEVIPAGIWK